MSAIERVDLLKRTVSYIFSREVSSEGTASLNPLGTGFLVAVPHHEAEGQIWPYLVTAKHVLKLNSGRYRREIFIRNNLRNWSPNSNQPGVNFSNISVTDAQGNLEWSIHSNPAVDIAVVQRFPPAQLYDAQAVPTIAFMTRDTFQRAGIVEGSELFFPCFTPEIPQRRRNNPVIRFGRISLISNEEIQTPQGNVNFHFAECFPFGGNSGSPVFTRVRTSTAETYGLIGIMIGHFDVARPISIQETQPRLLTSQHLGIATVIPVDYLKEILYSDALRRQRREIS